jgi:hypothetical protein
MYLAHPSETLNRVFSNRPFQGAEPEAATFLFIGLDANYGPEIERSPIFAALLDYMRDGVSFWRSRGVHHPFLLPKYGKRDGARYHRTFASIGFRPEHADAVSFIELLHVPTGGTCRLGPSDLKADHLRRIEGAIRGPRARHVFIPAGVARLMRSSGIFDWLPAAPVEGAGALGIWRKTPTSTLFCHYHLSVWGHQEQKQAQLAEIGKLIGATPGH